MNVLIIDSEAFLAELVCLALEADGHFGVVVASVDEASAMLLAVRVELLLLDLGSAGNDPLSWLEGTILAHAELQGRIFVLNDRQLSLEASARLLACGARVLEKPVTLAQILETVGAIVPIEARQIDPPVSEPSIEA
jgi:DNA-binding response OmpR family regulator